MTCAGCGHDVGLHEGVLGRTASDDEAAAWQCNKCLNWTPFVSPNSKLAKLAEELDAVPRQGADEDKPEGARYVTISDTALRSIVNVIREASAAPKS